jgi:competence protein ComEC
VQQHRFYIFLISFLAGVATATVFDTSLPVITWICLVAAGLMVVSARRSEASSSASVVTITLALLFCSIGLLRFETASWQFGQSDFQEYVGKEIVFEGTVIKEPDKRETSTRLYVEVQEELLLVATDKNSPVRYGDRVTVTGKLKAPEAFATELGRTFDYPTYLLVRGVEYQVERASVEVESSGHGLWLLEILFMLKQALMGSIEIAIAEPYAGLGEGLLLGVKQAIGEDIESAFRSSGIIHIVVLSGYNVMLVVTFILFLLSFFFKKRTRIIVGLISIVLFALLVGLSATVVRASIMAGLLLWADYLGRTYDLKRALLAAGCVMVFHNPYLLIYDIGFQLSFMATLGLIVVAPIFESFVTDGFSKLKLKDFFISTLATQIAVLPLLIYHIGEVSLVAVVVNVLVLPIVPLAMLLTFTAGVVGFVSVQLSLMIGFLAYLTLRYIIEVAVFFSNLPLASIIIPPIPAWSVVVLYAIIGLGMYMVSKAREEKESLSDWVIEEEIEKAECVRRTHSAPSEVPIFFR